MGFVTGEMQKKIVNFYRHFENWQKRQFEAKSASLRHKPKSQKNSKVGSGKYFRTLENFFRFRELSKYFCMSAEFDS